MSEQKFPRYAISLHGDDRQVFIEKLIGLLTPFPEVHAAAVAQAVKEVQERWKSIIEAIEKDDAHFNEVACGGAYFTRMVLAGIRATESSQSADEAGKEKT